MSIDRFDHNANLDHETKPVKLRRLEIITWPERRRAWPREEKLKIVAQNCLSGVVISEVALRHGLRPQQLFAWRNQFPKMMTTSEPPAFVPASPMQLRQTRSNPPWRTGCPGRRAGSRLSSALPRLGFAAQSLDKHSNRRCALHSILAVFMGAEGVANAVPFKTAQ